MIRPDFTPYGRYLIDVSSRKVTRETGGSVLFHDMENLKEECEVTTLASLIARFNNTDWALQRGYSKCQYCFLTDERVGRVAEHTS